MKIPGIYAAMSQKRRTGRPLRRQLREPTVNADARLRGPLPERPSELPQAGPLRSNFAQADFEAGVRRIQELIRAGDAIQVRVSAPPRC